MQVITESGYKLLTAWRRSFAWWAQPALQITWCFTAQGVEFRIIFIRTAKLRLGIYFPQSDLQPSLQHNL